MAEGALEALAGGVVGQTQAPTSLALGLIQHEDREQELGIFADDSLKPSLKNLQVLGAGRWVPGKTM